MVRSGGYTRRLWEGPEGPEQTGEMVFRPHEVHQKCKVLHWWGKKPRHWSMLMATQLESSCAEKEPWLSNMNIVHALSFCLRVKELKVCLVYIRRVELGLEPDSPFPLPCEHLNH